MAFDYKKEYREFYLPPKKPQLITIPPMNFAAVQGRGDPNEPNGEYKAAIELLYGIAYTLKMSYKGQHKIDGYFKYVVPPLEGLWHQAGVNGVDYAHKETFEWTSMIRLPEFVAHADFDWAVQEATVKKKRNRGMSLTSETAATTKSIFPTRARQPRKSARRCCVIRFEKNNSGQIHKRCRFWL
mgnify:CR=1 FL=1